MKSPLMISLSPSIYRPSSDLMMTQKDTEDTPSMSMNTPLNSLNGSHQDPLSSIGQRALKPALLLYTLALSSLFLSSTLSAKETACTDGKDNDADTVYDCGDADCAQDPACQPDGAPENTDARCHDWIDNDEDGAVDCEDQECQTDNLGACLGSWDLKKKAATSKGHTVESTPSKPALSSGDPRELLGAQGDNDGERNDQLCSDGIDNDNDGKIDCEDIGCQFDDSVQICRGSPNMRFSIVGQIAHSYDLEAEGDLARSDSRFARLQLRSFGPIPQIQNSFYLVSLLTERTPRLTFAMFSVPIGKTRHSLNINSGAAGLSQAQALSIHKQLLLRRTGVFRAFEQFNAAAVELSGPLNANNTLRYRAFAAGGSGRYDGNIGGRSVTDETLNYPWSGGAQVGVNLIGYYSRFDSPFLYVPVPLTVGLLAGAKYDRREREHFFSSNVQAAVRYRRFVMLAEHYYKQEFEFDGKQEAYHAQVGALLIPKHLMVAADFGTYEAAPFKNPPERYSSIVREPKDEYQYRFAAHWYFYRDIGVLSMIFNNRFVEKGNRDGTDLIERDVQAVAQYRF